MLIANRRVDRLYLISCLMISSVKQKNGTKSWYIRLWNEILNTYRIKIYREITSSKNKNLKVKMWMKCISCHPDFGYLFPFAHGLTYFDFWALRCQVIVPWIFFICMHNNYKICKVPINWISPTNARIVFNIRDYTIGCGKYRSILCNYEIYCVSKLPCMSWRGSSVYSF